MTLQANQEPAAEATSSPSPAEQFRAEFKERASAAVEKLTGIRDSSEGLGEVVDEESDTPPPKERTRTNAAATSGTASHAEPQPPGSGSASPTDTDTSAADPDRAPPQPRYDSKSFSKWVTNNPEKAAELAAKVFKVQLGENPDGWKKHFIAAEGKRRRLNEALDKRETELKAEREQVDKMVSDTLGSVQPLLDVIEAGSKDDFPAVDLFIEQAFGISFNDYCARRLRGASKESASERAAKLKAEKLERELAELKAGKGEPESKKGDAKAPAVSDRWLDSEVPSDHAVRDLAGWQQKVQEVYQDSFDPDTEEYDLSIEDAADRVFNAWQKKRAPAPEAVKTKPKAKPVKRRPRDEDDDEPEERTPTRDLELSETPPDDPAERARWALARAMKRR